MNNKILLGAMLIATAGIFTSCEDDRDSNPTLIQPKEFTLNTPAYADLNVNLSMSESLKFTWSQPQFTAENAPINATYEVQLSPTGNFTVSTAEAETDEEGTLVADYAVIDKTTTMCATEVAANEFGKALIKVTKWAEDAVPELQEVYVRINAFVLEGSTRLYSVTSNAVKINVIPYYIELKDAAPIMWYMLGNTFGDGAWSNAPGISSFPMFLQSGYTYDKTTGGGEITYLNYFTTDGWKIQPADFNWDFGFMSGGEKNTAVFRNGGGDAGNIWCDPAGYYLVTVNTANNTCTIVPQDITPTVYDMICITGSFCDWGDTNMTPVCNSGINHVWCHTLTVPAGEVAQIKFKIAGSWDTNWGYGTADGEINVCGKGTNGGKNIGVAEGTWIIMFNDITGEFSMTPVNG